MSTDEKDTHHSLAMTSIIVALIAGFVAGVGVAGGW